MHHPLHRSLKAAYSFYNIHTQTPLLDLMNDALILAKLVILLSAFKHLPVPKTTADEISDININSNKKMHV